MAKQNEIPKEVLKKLESYSSKLGISLGELKQRLTNLYKEDVKEYPKATKHWKRANKRLRGMLRREEGSLLSNAIMFKGYFFGDTGLIDFADIARRKVERYIDKFGEESAFRKGLIDEDANPLATRDFLRGPKKGEPIPDTFESNFRALYGVATVYTDKEEVNYKFNRLSFNDDAAVEAVYEFYTPYLFRATVRDSKTFYDLNATSVTRFRETEPFDVESAIFNCGYKVWKLTELEEALAMLGKDTRTPILTIGEASIINAEVNQKTGNRSIILDDEDLEWETGVRCFVNGEFPIVFGEDSRVVVVGSLGTMGEGNREQIIINGYGFYPLKEFLRKKE